MQLRKLLNDYPGLTTAISIGLLLIALGVVGYQLWARSQAVPQGDPRLKMEPRQDLDVDAQARAACGTPVATARVN
jgi:hypothetical protein